MSLISFLHIQDKVTYPDLLWESLKLMACGSPFFSSYCWDLVCPLMNSGRDILISALQSCFLLYPHKRSLDIVVPMWVPFSQPWLCSSCSSKSLNDSSLSTQLNANLASLCDYLQLHHSPWWVWRIFPEVIKNSFCSWHSLELTAQIHVLQQNQTQQLFYSCH